jgi:hypothetical protein
MSSYGGNPLGSQFSQTQESFPTSITASETSCTAPTASSISLDPSSQNAIRSFIDFRARQGIRIASLKESTKSLAVLQALQLGCNQEEQGHWRRHCDAFCEAFTELLLPRHGWVTLSDRADRGLGLPSISRKMTLDFC